MCKYFIISAAFGQLSIVTPSPVEIGSEMTVKCAASTVGGVGVFTHLGTLRIVRKLSLKVSDTETWAQYAPLERIANLKKVSNLGLISIFIRALALMSFMDFCGCGKK